jgi:hypothetical protein
MESIRVAMETKDRVGFVLEFHDTMRLARILNRLEGLSWSQDNINLFNNKIDSLRLSCTRPWYADSSNLNYFNLVYEGNRIEMINRKLRYNEEDCVICYDKEINSVTVDTFSAMTVFTKLSLLVAHAQFAAVDCIHFIR